MTKRIKLPSQATGAKGEISKKRSETLVANIFTGRGTLRDEFWHVENPKNRINHEKSN